jgi:hypothetical protein
MDPVLPSVDDQSQVVGGVGAGASQPDPAGGLGGRSSSPNSVGVPDISLNNATATGQDLPDTSDDTFKEKTAEDEGGDKMDKKWVGKAKKIVDMTKGDPYSQEEAVAKLQADYLRRRFDKEVKLPNQNED